MQSFVTFHLTEVNIVTIKIFPTNRWVDKCVRRRQNYSSVEMRMKMIIIVINKNKEKNGKWRKFMSTVIGVFHVKRDTLGSIIKLRRNQNETKTKRKRPLKSPQEMCQNQIQWNPTQMISAYHIGQSSKRHTSFRLIPFFPFLGWFRESFFPFTHQY